MARHPRSLELTRRLFPAVASIAALLGCSPATRDPARQETAAQSDSAPAGAESAKRVSFAILEDYDKGEDLAEVARDFALMRDLGVRTWRGSFGWDDYEPVPGRYDFAWLHQFAELAERHGIELRPYIGYTPQWAASGREADGQTWNDPPANREAWRKFVGRLVAELKRHRNIRSYEIYNEENVKLWWDGTAAEYAAVAADAAAAIRAADPDAEILLGGMVWPDAEWLESACTLHGNAARLDVVPFHAYPETWTPESVAVENYLDAAYRDTFLAVADSSCGRKPIWINETGFATTPGKTEREQANWWARATATFLAAPRIEHIGIYEIKDLRLDSPVIGDAPNYHLGITRRDRSKKLAFHTVDLLTDLLDVGRIVVADADVHVVVTGGGAGELYHHLFVRPDGEQVLIVWDKTAGPTLDVRLDRRGRSATEYGLDGARTAYAAFDGHTLRGIRLTPGDVRIFRVTPDRER
jgi:hypothetical protein